MVCGEALRTKLHVVDRPDLPPGSYDPQRLRGDVGEVVLAHNPRAGALHAEGLPHRQRCSQCGHAVWAYSGQWACTVGKHSGHAVHLLVSERLLVRVVRHAEHGPGVAHVADEQPPAHSVVHDQCGLQGW